MGIIQHNSFEPQTRELFVESWECWFCGKNTADALHHIVGRGTKDQEVEKSPLNACPICNQGCHLPNHGLLKTDDVIRRMLARTYDYLTCTGYKLTERDGDFIMKYIEYYN